MHKQLNEKTMTFNEVDKLSQDFASYLQNHLKLKKGDRVAIQMPNCLQYPVAMFGVLRAGMVVVNTNPLYTPTEMKHQFNDSGASAIVILANFACNLEKIYEEIEAKQGRLQYLQSRVSMSTIIIEMYTEKPEGTGTRISYGSKMWNAITSGFNGLSSFFLGLLQIWPFILILAIVFFLVRRKLRRKNP